MLKICTYFNAITALFTARFSSGLGVQGYPPPPRNVDKTYISEYASSSAFPCVSSGRLLSGHPSSRRQSSLFSFLSSQTKPRAARNFFPKRTASTALPSFLAFVIFISAGLFATSAKALPEGLHYCHDDNGTMVASDLTKTPPDAPTAICRVVNPDLITNFSDYYDESYMDDFSVNGAYPFFNLVGSGLTKEDIAAMEPRLPNYRKLAIARDYDFGGIEQNTDFPRALFTSAFDANRRFFSAEYANAVGIFYANANANVPAQTTFILPTTIENVRFFSLAHVTRKDSSFWQPGYGDISYTISLIDESDNSVETNLTANAATDVVWPADGTNGTWEQPDKENLVWEPAGDAQRAHIANHNASAFPFEISAKVFGFVFDAPFNVKQVRITTSDLANTANTSNLFTGSGLAAFLMFSHETTYEEIFPLPEGCVVPTPA